MNNPGLDTFGKFMERRDSFLYGGKVGSSLYQRGNLNDRTPKINFQSEMQLTLVSNPDFALNYLLLFLILLFYGAYLYYSLTIAKFDFFVSIIYPSVGLLGFLIFFTWMSISSEIWNYELDKVSGKFLIWKIPYYVKLRKGASKFSDNRKTVKDIQIENISNVQILRDTSDLSEGVSYQVCILLKETSKPPTGLRLSERYDLNLRQAQQIAGHLANFLNVEKSLEPKLLDEWLDEIFGVIT
jgi:hypothetical protein